jgi:hypothetical protein
MRVDPEIVSIKERRMVDFCTFMDRDGNVIAVNPLQVRCVRHSPQDAARIEFDDNHFIIVRASVVDVANGLRTGKN